MLPLELRWSRTSAAYEIEFADARVPVKTAGVSVVLTHGPEAHVIGGIDRGHAIIAPAAVGAGLAASAGEHCRFPLAKVTWRVTDEAPRITNPGERGRARRCIANGSITRVIDGDAGHKAIQTVIAIGPGLLLNRSGGKGAAGHIELIPANTRWLGARPHRYKRYWTSTTIPCHCGSGKPSAS